MVRKLDYDPDELSDADAIYMAIDQAGDVPLTVEGIQARAAWVTRRAAPSELTVEIALATHTVIQGMKHQAAVGQWLEAAAIEALLKLNRPDGSPKVKRITVTIDLADYEKVQALLRNTSTLLGLMLADMQAGLMTRRSGLDVDQFEWQMPLLLPKAVVPQLPGPELGG